MNTVVHETVARHTNRPESSHFLNSETIEYKSQAEKMAREFNWNDEDREYIAYLVLEKAKDKLSMKYADVEYAEDELVEAVRKAIREIIP